MRVVFLTHNYPRTPDDIAGAFLAPLAVALAGRGHDVRVIAPSDAGRGGHERIDGVSVQRVRYASGARERYAYTGRMQDAIRTPAGWLALGGLLRAMRRAARTALNDERDAVVHAHWWFPAGLAAPPERPCVVTLHGTDVRLLTNPVARLLAGRALGSPRVITAVSRAVARLADGVAGRPIDDAHISPMPVAGRSAASSALRASEPGGLVVVGRLTGQKRVGLALEALALLGPAAPPDGLTIVGDGPERVALERQVEALGLRGRVTFLGMLAPERVGPVLARSAVLVFPAAAEGLGLVAIEALAAGIPVVACEDGGGVLDVLREPGAGLVVPPRPPDIAAAIRQLLRDPEARDRAAAAGQAWRARLEPDRVAARCEAWYREAIGA